MSMRDMENLKAFLCDDIGEIANMGGNLNKSDLEYLHLLTDTVKNINKIVMLEGGDGNGYSNTGNMYSNRRYYYSNDNGYSRYNNGGNTGRIYRGMYSSAEGRDMMIEKLKDMMETTTDQNERNILQHAYDQLIKK